MNTNYYFLPGNVVADLNIKLLAASLSNKVDFLLDRKSTRLNSSHNVISRMPSSA